MKTAVLISLSIALLAVAGPLGDRTLVKKHNGTPLRNARRYLLQSRLDSPAACAALPLVNTTASPDLSNSTTTDVNTTTANNSTTADNPTIVDLLVTDNSTSADNTASIDNTTAALDAESSTVSRRWHSLKSRKFKRIAQDDLPDIALSWQKLCLVSGGDIFTLQPCVEYAGLSGLNALLADADPCAQQDNADRMIAFAKSPGVTNRDALIADAIAYRKHPRNALNILGVVPSTPYCQKAPKSEELVGIVNEQLDGVDPGLFGSPSIPIMPFGAPGTCPFGLTPDVATCTCVNGTDASGTDSTATDTGVSSTAESTDVATSTEVGGTATASVASVSATATVAAETDTKTVDDTPVSSTPVPATTINIPSPTVTASPKAATPTVKSTGPNVQPDDISGDVNDING